MSYDIYKDKRVYKLPNGKLMFLAKIADSSLTDENGGHPAHWNICTDLNMCPSMFLTKEEIDRQRKEMVEKQKKLIADYLRKYDNKVLDSDILDENNYYGTVYRGSRKIRAMYSFYGIRKTFPIESLYGKFSITLGSYDHKTYKTIESWRFDISSIEDLTALDAKYQKLREDKIPICIDVSGLYD